MVELERSVIHCLVQSRSSWTDEVRLNIAITALLVTEPDSNLDYEVRSAIFKGLRAEKYRVDSKLLTDLYAVCPGRLRARLICSTPFGSLGPAVFEPRFLETYRRKQLAVLERRDLALALERYLWGHPARADPFASIILELLRSSEWEYRLRGLMMVGMLSEVAEADQELILRALRDKSHEIRCQACNGLCELAKRRSKVSPRFRAFCMSPEVKEIVFDLYKHDPDVDVQTCAYYFLKAREPRAGHKPPKGMPVPPPRRKRRTRR